MTLLLLHISIREHGIQLFISQHSRVEEFYRSIYCRLSTDAREQSGIVTGPVGGELLHRHLGEYEGARGGEF